MEFKGLSRVPFSGRVLILGCGSVAQCTLPLLLRHVVAPGQITVMDFVDNSSRIQSSLDQGVTYVLDRVEKQNLDEVLGRYLAAGDMVINLAWNIDACDILQWCHDHGALYLDTSVEVWEPYADAALADPRDRSLYVRHMALRQMTATWDRPGPTAVLEHGANPGLVSHFVKDALDTIAKQALADGHANK